MKTLKNAIRYPFLGSILVIACLCSCNSNESTNHVHTLEYTSQVKVAGAMKRVMRQGKLDGIIRLDTIAPKKELYGIGPVSYLRGEVLINNGKTFVSRVLLDSTMLVEENNQVSAPFLVYGHVTHWEEKPITQSISSLKELEGFVAQFKKETDDPFIFKLKGQIDQATIHIQNLPEGSEVKSPKDAHQGQVKYPLGKQEVEIIGFYSTKHHGVFTHHDANTHMHLITKDGKAMGHLDEMSFSGNQFKLYLPF